MTDDSGKLWMGWCDSIVDTLHPQSILVIGARPEEIITCFQEKNISVEGATWGDPAALGLQQLDVVIFKLDSESNFLDLSEKTLGEQFGTARAILALIPLVGNGPSLPEVSQWLIRFGYSRALGEENWLGQQFFTAIYRKDSVNIDRVLWQHEAEWWRLAQLSQKQRVLLSEYLDENIETTFRYENQIVQLNLAKQQLADWSRKLQQDIQKQEDWSRTLQHALELQTNAYNSLQEENAELRKIKARWEAFENSSFAKVWKRLKKIS